MFSPENIHSILDEIERGNREAFRWIVREWSLSIRGYLASQLHHLDAVDDLAQEVFITAFRSLSTFRRGEDFGAWLRGIARHKLLAYFRGSARRESALERFRSEVVECVRVDLEAGAAGDSPEVMERLLRCIAKLPEKLRRVVHAGLEEYKPAALAEELSTSVGAIYQLHYRANQLLRECLRGEAP
jgi:RNA polymerase sigma-70 factor (ECF subfamily)